MRQKKIQIYDNWTVKAEEPRKLMRTLQTMSSEKYYVWGRPGANLGLGRRGSCLGR